MKRLHSQRVALPVDDPSSPDDLVVSPAWVDLEGGKIVAVHTVAPSDDPNVEVIDYGEQLITPAFINAHTHVALGVMRGMNVEAATAGNMVEDLFFTFESRLRPDDVAAFARMGAYESLLQGVGLVWDHYYEAEALVTALRETGISAVVAPTLQDLAGPGVAHWEAQLDATIRLQASDELKRDGIFFALGPHATDTVSASLWSRVAEASETYGLPVHAHLAQSVEEYERAQERHGCSPTAWLKRLGVLELDAGAVFAHLLYASSDDLELLAPERHRPVFCPYSQLVFGFPAPMLRWERQGLDWLVATDCSANNDSMNVQKELRYCAGQRSATVVFSEAYERFFRGGDSGRAREVWEARMETYREGHSAAQTSRLLSRVWGAPGRAHPSVRAGVIQPGALANILVWDVEHPSLWPNEDLLRVIAMGDTTGAIHAMYVAGRPVGEPGDFHRSIRQSGAYREAHREAEARLSEVLRR